ncbi:MAG: hypothetical protein NVSMB65_22040 [Chloroflexota bacterium]
MAGVALLRAQAQEHGRPTPTIAAHMRLRLGAPGGTDEPHLAGSVEEVAMALQGYRDAGLEYLICDFVAAGLDDLLGQMRTMAEHIMPGLRR